MTKRNQKQVTDKRWTQKEVQGRVVRDEEHTYVKPPVQAKNTFQKQFLHALNTKQVIAVMSPAGTGKSFVSMSEVCDWVKKGVYDKMILTRPAVTVGKTIGLLPGDLNEKFAYFIQPLINVIKDRYGCGFYENGLKNGTIVMQPLEYIRGHSIKDVVVLDEGQLLSPDELFTMMTRIEEGGKLIIIGDPAQRDNRGSGPDAITWLKGFVERHRLYEHFAVLEATSDDIVRSGLCKDLVKAREFDMNRGRKEW